MLAVIFGAERFQTYVYGRSFTIKSDHKPLESISQKNLADMPAHLQCMLLHLQGYDYTIHFCPGKEMALPNTLSWFSPYPGLCIWLDIVIHHACLSPERKEAYQQAFVSDPEMCTLTNMIITGWPDDIKVVPCPLCPYWQHQEILTIEDCPTLRSPHHPYIRKGEDATATPPVPSRNHQSPVVCSWMCLLAGHKQGHRRSSLGMWDLHSVPGPEFCSTPHSDANSILPMADVCHRHLHLGRNWLPDMWWLQRWSSSDIFHLTRATLSKLSHCSKRCSQSTEFPKYSALTTALSMQVHSSLSSAPLGVSHMRPQGLTTHNWMDSLRHV